MWDITGERKQSCRPRIASCDDVIVHLTQGIRMMEQKIRNQFIGDGDIKSRNAIDRGCQTPGPHTS